MKRAILALADGTTFEGLSLGATGEGRAKTLESSIISSNSD